MASQRYTLAILILGLVYYIAFPAWHHVARPRQAVPKPASNSYVARRFPTYNRTQIGTENATMVMLARNSDLKGALASIRLLEDRFNRDYRYPWVFLNDVPFDDEFIEQTLLMASSQCFYELIPASDWQPPPSINKTRLDESLADCGRRGVIYGGLRLYRNMCHFNLGYFFKQPRMLQFQWYFRVEPDVEYMCDFQSDPFALLRANNKVYGFVMAIHEYEDTIPTLWPTVERFMETHPELLHPDNALEFLTTKEPLGVNNRVLMVNSLLAYNMCHFWLNFEIGSLDFFRSEAYDTYFRFLDSTGGFFYERWGDAPVHLIALALLADRDAIHHFEDIGYYHAPLLLCPMSLGVRAQKRCVCKLVELDGKMSDKGIDVELQSCLPRWWKYGAGKTFLEMEPE